MYKLLRTTGLWLTGHWSAWRPVTKPIRVGQKKFQAQKTIFIISLFMSSFFLSAQVGGVLSQTSPWTGSYQGNINGTNSILTFEKPGSQVRATIDADGYIYNLSGRTEGNSWQGYLEDGNTGGKMDFRAISGNGSINLVLFVPDQTGQVSEWPLEFRRAGLERGSQSPGSTRDQQGNSSGSVQRDPYLVGGWRHTESYTSGEFGMVSEWYMNINEDGTYTYGDGKIAGGDGGSSFNSGGNSGHTTGKWKTENKIVYIDEGYGWQAYARYYVEGNSLMFTFGDGSKQLWERFR